MVMCLWVQTVNKVDLDKMAQDEADRQYACAVRTGKPCE